MYITLSDLIQFVLMLTLFYQGPYPMSTLIMAAFNRLNRIVAEMPQLQYG